MERIKKRKMKFPCLFGGNDESPRCRPVQACSHTDTEHSLFKFEVGKSTSKRRNGNRMKKFLAKGTSSKKRSPSILAKLMRRGRLSSKKVVLNPKSKNGKIVDHSSDKCNKNTKGFESGHIGIYGYNCFEDESVHVLRSGYISESEETTMSFRIIIHQHDRLTHSPCHVSESSLISEAANRMLERWNTTHIKEDEGTLRKVSMLGDKETGSSTLQPSFNDPHDKRNVCHDDDDDEKIYGELSNEGRRKVKKDVFSHEEDMPLKIIKPKKRFRSSRKSNGTYYKNEDPAKYQPSTSDIDDHDQLSGPESEDEAFASNGFESIKSRLQDLKKSIHLLTIESKLNSNKLRLIPKVKHIGQLSSVPEPASPESAYMAHILQTLETYATETIYQHVDPRLFNCLEKFYFEGTTLLRIEKRLFYDYIEQMFIRASKSTVAYPWVNCVKRESQLMLPKLSFVDQIRNVVDEIEKDEDEDFCEVYYDKDSQWVQLTNEIDVLGKFVAELVLNDLLMEVIDL